MKRFAWLSLATVGLVTNAGAVLAQAQRPQSLVARVDSLFAPWNKSNSPGCILGVSQNGALVHERGYGMANLELGVAITPASVFHVASISKQFTAMSILLLAKRGQISLDDEVRRYITELPDYGTRLTVRHLLTHTSGLRSGFALRNDLAEPRDDDIDGDDSLVRILARQRALNFTPGTEYQYNNSGYALLAIVVKRMSGQSLRAFADSNIFKPLGMMQTHFHDNRTMIVPNRTSGYYVDASGLHLAIDEWTQTYNNKNPGNQGVGNSNLFTTARDLLLWEQNFVDVQVGDPALIAAMQTPTVLTGGDTSSYGLGLNMGRYRGLRTIDHSGGDPGYGAYLVRYPDQGLAIAVLCNVEGVNRRMLTGRVADIYLGKFFSLPPASSATAPPTVSLSAEQLASKVGLYRDPSNYALRRIFVRGGKLMGYAGAFAGVSAGTELRPVSANRFLLPGGTIALEFVPAVASRPQEIREFAEERAKPLVFQQVNAFTPSSTELRAFEGEYVSPELETTYKLAARDSGLVVQVRGRADIVLRPVFGDAFQGSRVGVVKFSRDTRGVVTGFTVNNGSVRNLRFDRVEAVNATALSPSLNTALSAPAHPPRTEWSASVTNEPSGYRIHGRAASVRGCQVKS
ncbi:MAG: beta-lactamase family protein [Gemmatimonadota bacterium]|nr:beta-lactamase family protein [Gemmatimonadota bacterium]